MRIDANHGALPLSESGNTATQNNQAASASASSGLTGQDQAQLSGAHTQVQALAAQVAQLPEVRQERVHALRLAVQGGNYRPSPESLAEAIVSHMLVEPAA
jgi:negative regulator of flagellin synthesis FlgM